MDPVAAFAEQAKACAALGSPMYAALLNRLVADLEAGGPTRRVLEGHEDDPGRRRWRCGCSAACTGSCWSAGPVSSRRTTPASAAPGTRTGGAAAFLSLLEEQPDVVREWLDRPPQTNEVGRSTALVGGAAAPAGRAASTGAALRDRLVRRAEPARRRVRVRRRRRDGATGAVGSRPVLDAGVVGQAADQVAGTALRANVSAATSDRSTSPRRRADWP